MVYISMYCIWKCGLSKGLWFVGRYWEMVERLKLSHFYTAPTAIRLLLKAGDSWVKKYDTSSLRILGCGGSD